MGNENEIRQLPFNIFLVGMMGSGKSHWSRLLGDHYHLPAFDLDALIEKEYGMSVVDFFAEHGETAFRAAETTMLHSGIPASRFILATGGGTPCFNANMDYMLANGLVIFLNPGIETLVTRLKHEVAKRPVLAGTNGDEKLMAEKIEGLLLQRAPWYSQAAATINSDHPEMPDFTKKINGFLRT